MDWKQKVTDASEKIFPGLTAADSAIKNDKCLENIVMANLPLQMCLYFNATFCPVWMFVLIKFLIDRYDCLGDLNRYLFVTVAVNVIIAEVVRLYFGYKGNLNDKIPELAAFWLISLLLQLPLQGVLLVNPNFGWRVLEVITQGLMIAMLVTEIATGYVALKRTSIYQTNRFRILRANRYKIDTDKTM